MSYIDKNQAVIDYILQCPTIQDIESSLYFNFINASDNSNQFVTQSNNKYLGRKYIDGSESKQYSFMIVVYKSANDIAVPKLPGYSNENILDMSDIQAVVDWIEAQDDLQHYPDFGDKCIIDSIHATSENPSFDGIDDQVSPPLAVYSITVDIQYLDISKKIWG